MNDELHPGILEICRVCGSDPARLMDIVRAVQARYGGISDEGIDLIASTLGIHRVQVESQVSFYAFLGTSPRGGIVIRLCDDVIDRMQGYDAVLEAFQRALGIPLGSTTADGRFTLEATPCIGMCDQAPAALISLNAEGLICPVCSTCGPRHRSVNLSWM